MTLTALNKALVTSALICAMSAVSAETIGTKKNPIELMAGAPYTVPVFVSPIGSFNDVLRFTSPVSSVFAKITFDYQDDASSKYRFTQVGQTAGKWSGSSFTGADLSNLAITRTFNFIADTTYRLQTIGSGSISNFSMVMTPVPDPETYAMLLVGLGLMGVIARRRKQTDV